MLGKFKFPCACSTRYRHGRATNSGPPCKHLARTVVEIFRGSCLVVIKFNSLIVVKHETVIQVVFKHLLPISVCPFSGHFPPYLSGTLGKIAYNNYFGRMTGFKLNVLLLMIITVVTVSKATTFEVALSQFTAEQVVFFLTQNLTDYAGP